MNKLLLCLFFITGSCNTGNLKVIADLPKTLSEVSGTETTANSKLIWMLNDGGNKPILYGVNTKGKIKKELKINAKNKDWEELTSDDIGNLYIGDFGNNANNRKNLNILIVKASDLESDKNINVERISFSYPDQTEFPPKNKKMRFDCEAFFYYKDNLYLFTKSRIKNNFGNTHLYKIPAKKGHYIAEHISEFNSCNELPCWITSADISDDKTTIALLSLKGVLLFKDFKDDNFLSGTATYYDFKYESQKEGVCFKNGNTLYITDESYKNGGRNLYEFKID